MQEEEEFDEELKEGSVKVETLGKYVKNNGPRIPAQECLQEKPNSAGCEVLEGVVEVHLMYVEDVRNITEKERNVRNRRAVNGQGRWIMTKMGFVCHKMRRLK